MQIEGVPGSVRILAAIGQVCLQWARLEMALIGLLSAFEEIDTERAYILFGGLDILPRINMVLNLGRHHKLPRRFLSRIEAVRTLLQKGGLADRRNQVVHGAHRDIEDDSTTLTMIRWKGAKRHKTMTATEIHHLGMEIYEAGNEVWSIFEDFGEWKFGPEVGAQIKASRL